MTVQSPTTVGDLVRVAAAAGRDPETVSLVVKLGEDKYDGLMIVNDPLSRTGGDDAPIVLAPFSPMFEKMMEWADREGIDL